jgi:hypothetical protein
MMIRRRNAQSNAGPIDVNQFDLNQGVGTVTGVLLHCLYGDDKQWNDNEAHCEWDRDPRGHRDHCTGLVPNPDGARTAAVCGRASRKTDAPSCSA